MLMTNFYGDVLSNLCSCLIGGFGLIPFSNIGEAYAMFEAVHGSAFMEEYVEEFLKVLREK